MNYFNYPCNNHFVNQIQYQPLYQPILPVYSKCQFFQQLKSYHTISRTQLVNVTQRQLHMITYYSSPQQQDTVAQELLKDTTIAMMKQSSNKMERVCADAVDLRKSENPVEYILKAITLLKEIFNV